MDEVYVRIICRAAICIESIWKAKKTREKIHSQKQNPKLSFGLPSDKIKKEIDREKERMCVFLLF